MMEIDKVFAIRVFSRHEVLNVWFVVVSATRRPVTGGPARPPLLLVLF